MRNQLKTSTVINNNVSKAPNNIEFLSTEDLDFLMTEDNDYLITEESRIIKNVIKTV